MAPEMNWKQQVPTCWLKHQRTLPERYRLSLPTKSVERQVWTNSALDSRGVVATHRLTACIANLATFGVDLQARTPGKSLRTKSVTYVVGINRNPCVRNGPLEGAMMRLTAFRTIELWTMLPR
jgi:hypothetical protein